MGTLGIGIIPATGCGYRMMWYPFRGAFRAGTTDDGGACNYWDDANIGFYSWAGGNLTRATAFASFAFGDQVTVTGVDAAVVRRQQHRLRAPWGSARAATTSAPRSPASRSGWNNRAAGRAPWRSASGCTPAPTGPWRSAAARTRITPAPSPGPTRRRRIRCVPRANNRFHTRAAGGYRLYTNSAASIGVSLASSGNSWSSLSDRNRKENFAARRR
jgi:trimeric autotransporter adhesin